MLLRTFGELEKERLKMATLDELIKLTQQESFYKAGGGDKPLAEGLNETFSNINTIINQRLEAKKRELETRKLEEETAKSFEIDETIPESERQGLTETQRSRIANLKSKVDTMNTARRMQAEDRGEQFQPFDYPKEITSLENAPIPTTRKRKVSKGEYETYTQGKLREAQAQAALRERPQSDFTPFLATKDIEALTGGKIKEGSMTNMAIVKQFSAGERAETMAEGAMGRANLPKQVSGEQIDKVVQMRNAIDGANDIKRQFFDLLGRGKSPVDPIGGRWEQLKSITGFQTDQEIAKFQTDAIAQLNTYLNTLSGAAITEQEAERLRQRLPGVGMTKEQFLGRMDSFYDELNRSLGNRVKTLKDAGFKTGDLDRFITVQPQAEQFKIGEIKTNANGQKGRYMGNGKWLVVQ